MVAPFSGTMHLREWADWLGLVVCWQPLHLYDMRVCIVRVDSNCEIGQLLLIITAMGRLYQSNALMCSVRLCSTNEPFEECVLFITSLIIINTERAISPAVTYTCVQ